jgi:enoyl-CoA hydratase/carnithine racemase
MFRKSRDTTPAPHAPAHTPAKAHPPAQPPASAPKHAARPAPKEASKEAAREAARHPSRHPAPGPRAGGRTHAGEDAAPVVLHEHSDGVTLLTLNRPQARNSLSEAVLSALGEAFVAIAQDAKVRAVVIAANGPAFCAGHDLKELTAHRADADHGRAYFTHMMETCSALMQSIVRLPQPVIAAVQGVATAAGCQLVASCDLAVASSAAGFCTPGVDIGLFCTTPAVALARSVGRKAAMEMLLTGEIATAEHAAQIGLVNRVVPAGTEREHAITLARRIAAQSAMTVRLGKEAFYRQLDMGLKDAYRFASQVMVENMLRRDAAEGIGAFLEKRAPTWEDR